MCEYTRSSRVYRPCTRRPRHMVTIRVYELCWRQSAYGIQRHCPNSTDNGYDGGITPVIAPCPTCQDPNVTTIERYAVVQYEQSRAKTIA
ncbi:uncharacterized protein N7511_005320 [Penicillium nucicola]|uniref:uncharacterized protein n=1 Tax=Penicillium nucicola TaxID=1850975 RepID=UPI00254587EC|nr:uncharacterized protein N7511_005320 [Penicillium nucicola]KAJ5761938.1 hypothetical protein N7511_005320 [Penicillium nucicola]